jgi:hypothetical protein
MQGRFPEKWQACGSGCPADGPVGGAQLPWVRPLFENLLRSAALSARDPDAAEWFLGVLDEVDSGRVEATPRLFLSG